MQSSARIKLMERHRRIKHEPLLPVNIAVCILIGLQIAISDKLTLGPKYMLAAIEAVLLIGVTLSYPNNILRSQTLRRGFSLLLIIVVTLTNVASLALVVTFLIEGRSVDGHTLILSALAIYLTNILIFGLWYWEMDSPGLSGYVEPKRGPDFLFPQMSTKHIDVATEGWTPQFFDYLYISITNASAFSPTDTMPLTKRVKLIMSLQSLTSFITVALVTARAVNILR